MDMAALIPIDQLEMFANGLDHSEGIAMTQDGTVYVGGEAGQVYRIGADDSIEEILTTGGFMLGLAADGEGRLYGCDGGHLCVWRIDPVAKTKEVFCDGLPDRKLTSPNWGAFGPDGTYYFSDSGGWKERTGSVWVVRPGGKAEVWSEESVDFPNGCAVSPDGSKLYLLESTPGMLVEYPINADGSAGARRVVVELPGAVPDGVAVTTDGSLVISCYRPDIIYRFREDLGLQVLAEDPEGVAIAAPTNVAFTGPQLRTMMCPNIGRWHLTRFRHPDLQGVPLNYPTRAQLEGR
jgi:gluconolactonase